MQFTWNDWNIDHLAEHGVLPADAEAVVRRARSPYPQARPDNKFLVWGQDRGGRWLQVIFVEDELAEAIYVIHARPLTPREQRQLRRRRR